MSSLTHVSSYTVSVVLSVDVVDPKVGLLGVELIPEPDVLLIELDVLLCTTALTFTWIWKQSPAIKEMVQEHNCNFRNKWETQKLWFSFLEFKMLLKKPLFTVSIFTKKRASKMWWGIKHVCRFLTIQTCADFEKLRFFTMLAEAAKKTWKRVLKI